MGFDRTTRLLLIAGGALLLLALVFGVFTILGRDSSASLPATAPAPGTPASAAPVAAASPAPAGAPAPLTATAALPANGPAGTLEPTTTAAPAGPAAPGTPADAAAAPGAAPTDTSAAAAPTNTAAAAAPTDTAAPAGGSPGGPAPYLTPLRRPIVYSAMGASDTVGVGADVPDKQAWPVVIASRLPGDTRFRRFGIGGIVLGDALTAELPGTLLSRPTLVTVWLTANDLTHGVPLATYQQELNTLLGRLTTETPAQIVLLNLPDLSLVVRPGRYPGTPAQLRAVVQSWNVAIAATAAPYGDRVLLIDLFPATAQVTADSALVSGDNWHPSTAGYAAIADLVYGTMRQAGLLPAR